MEPSLLYDLAQHPEYRVYFSSSGFSITTKKTPESLSFGDILALLRTAASFSGCGVNMYYSVIEPKYAASPKERKLNLNMAWASAITPKGVALITSVLKGVSAE